MPSLFNRAQAGDPDALADLIRKHIPLVQSLNKRFSYEEDSFQQGCLGLVMAIRRFHEESGYQFSTYAVPVILGEMRRSKASALGWRARKTLHKAKDYEERMLQSSGKAPGILEMARAAETTPEELILLLENSQSPVADASGELLSSVPDPQSQSWIDRLLIRDILERMKERESWLLCKRFIEEKSQKEIADQWGIHQSTLSRHEKKACLSFRKAWTEN